MTAASCRGALFLLFLVSVPPAAAASFYDTLNHLRAGLEGCPGAGRAPPLIPRPELERVARNLAFGGNLQASMKQFGYRAIHSYAIHLEGPRVGTEAASIIVRQGYCRNLQDPELHHAGFYLHDDKLWIVLAAPFTPPSLTEAAAGARVLELANQARATARHCGDQPFAAAPPVRWNGVLAEAARRHAEDMARHNYMSHTGRDKSTPGQRVERAGYRYRVTGENIAGGPRMTPEIAVAGWIKSPGHCANLMNAEFTEMGAAYAVNAQSEMGVYWAQSFGVPR